MAVDDRPKIFGLSVILTATVTVRDEANRAGHVSKKDYLSAIYL